jgi:integrase
MLDLSLKNYVDWRVAQVIPVRSGFGYRVFLKYPDGSEKPQQKSGFKTEKEANKAREKTIAELYSGTFVVFAKVDVAEFMTFWLETDIKKRTDSYETYYNYCGIVKNHIIPILGKKKMMDVNRGDVQKLFNTKADYSRSVAEQVKTIMNVSFRYAITNKVILANPVDGIGLPKAERTQQKSGFRTRNIDTQKTLTMEQIQILLEKSKDTPIHMQVMFNVLMGLRRSEINGVKYSDVDYINHTLKVERQLGRIHNTVREDFAPKTFTKQEVGLKTRSSYREIPIPDYVFEAILKERRIYEKNRNRRKEEFQDLDYICCSTLGRARSKGFHCKYYKQLLAENGLPDIRWHDLRSTYCTLLLKESFNPKAVSKLMGHAKELITMDVYADNRGIIADGVPEIEEYMKEVLPNPEETEIFKKELLEIVVDVTEFLPDAV